MELSCEGPFVGLFDPTTPGPDPDSLAGTALGAPRARRKSTLRCEGDVKLMALLDEDAAASDLRDDGNAAALCGRRPYTGGAGPGRM